jgi:hypothetical protein
VDVYKDYLKELEEYFEEHGYDCEKCQKDIKDLKLLVPGCSLSGSEPNNK